MLTMISPNVLRAHPDLEDFLWHIACTAKHLDHNIQINGLFVRILVAPPNTWTGTAFPTEESILYRRFIPHPAGRINLRIAAQTTALSIVRLFGHELRHIGLFHEGRKQIGVLSDYHFRGDLEEECQAFEEKVIEVAGCLVGHSYSSSSMRRNHAS